MKYLYTIIVLVLAFVCGLLYIDSNKWKVLADGRQYKVVDVCDKSHSEITTTIVPIINGSSTTLMPVASTQIICDKSHIDTIWKQDNKQQPK